MKRIFCIIFTLLSFCVMFAISTFAGEWVQDGLEWKYKDGEVYLTNTWKLINSNNDYNNYYFNDKSHMVTGLYKIDDKIHAFSKDGVCLSNKKIRIDNIDYSTGNKGVVEDIDSDMLNLNYGGEWQFINGNYQFINNGTPVVNEWRIIVSGDKEYSYYYFDSIGNMLSGIQQINGKYHLLSDDGKANSHANIYLYNDITTETDSKGELTYLPDDFSIEKYKAKLEESLHAEENEKLALQKMNEEAKNIGPKTIATPIGNETVVKDDYNGVIPDSTYTMTLGEKGSAEITSDYDAKITINFQYPVVVGTNADAINNVIKTNLSKIIRNYFEDMYNSASKRAVLNLNGVDFEQIKDSHLLKFKFRGGSRYVIIYVNTTTLEIYSEN